MDSLLGCGRRSIDVQDGGFMPGEENFSSAAAGEVKQLIVVPPRRRVQKSKGLTARVWRRAFDAEGRCTDVGKLLEKVQRGGVDPSIRPEVWELLLGAWPLDSTTNERKALRDKRRVLYARVLVECRKIHPGIGSGKLAYAVNDSPILDARVSITSSSPGPAGSPVADVTPLPKERVKSGRSAELEVPPGTRAPRSTESVVRKGGGSSFSSERPPRRTSFSGAICLDKIKLGSKEAEELGWGAKFLLIIAERESRVPKKKGAGGETVWLEGIREEWRTLAGGAEKGGAEKEVGVGLAKGPEVTPKVDPRPSLGKSSEGLASQSGPKATPQIISNRISEFYRASSDLTAVATPEITPEINPETTPEVTPEINPETTAEVGPERRLPRAHLVSTEKSATGPNNQTEAKPASEAVPPKPSRTLGRVKTMVAEIERRVRAEAQEAEALLSRRPSSKAIEVGGRKAAERPAMRPPLQIDAKLRRRPLQEDAKLRAWEKGMRPLVTSAAKGDNVEVLMSAGGSVVTGGEALTSADGTAESAGKTLTSAAGPAEKAGAVLMSAAESAEDGKAVPTSATGPVGTVLQRVSSLEGLAFGPGPLRRSKSAAVIFGVDGNPESNLGEDEGFATPVSRFTTLSTPNEAFFTPNRSLSGFSTPQSAAFLSPQSLAYATPDEGFFTPERRVGGVPASPALSRGSDRWVKKGISTPSNWNARKPNRGGDGRVKEGGSNADIFSVKEFAGIEVGPSETSRGRGGGRNTGGDFTGGENVSNRSEEASNRGVLEPIVVQETRPLRSENPELPPPPLEVMQGPYKSVKSGLDSFYGSGVSADGKRHSFKGPSDLLLVVEKGTSLSALGQGSAGPSESKPTTLGRVSITQEGLRLQLTPPKSLFPVMLQKARLLNSSNTEGDSEGPVIPPAVEIKVRESAGKLITGPQAKKAAEWLWTLHRIVVDVVRTDRNLEFYDVTANLARMADILAVYAWMDPDVGYCQGMSDLLSPFVVLFEDDADAFWCFERLMRRVRHNFGMRGPVGVLRQLDHLQEIITITDPSIATHLEAAGVDNFLFAFRMLLVKFRRELSFRQALMLWEMIWAADFDSLGEQDEGIGSFANGESRSLAPGSSRGLQKEGGEGAAEGAGFDDELWVFCVIAILHHNRARLRREVHEMDDAVKLFNAMELKVDVRSCVESAIKRREKYLRKKGTS